MAPGENEFDTPGDVQACRGMNTFTYGYICMSVSMHRPERCKNYINGDYLQDSRIGGQWGAFTSYFMHIAGKRHSLLCL